MNGVQRCILFYKKRRVVAFSIVFICVIIGGVAVAHLPAKTFLIPAIHLEDEQAGNDSSKITVLAGSLTGMPCDNAGRRPFAVMLSSDAAARPLSGISEADIVVEMPVITGDITRLMAVYQCASPSEIGSVRSARHDFISLARAFDAVYIHWGGSHFAMDALGQGAIDNLDALRDTYGTFYRISRIPMPHNGFTSTERIGEGIVKAEYRSESKFKGFPLISESIDASHIVANGSLTIGYPGNFSVAYEYDTQTNLYTRYRGGIPENDYTTGSAVTTSNVIVLRALSRQIEDQYNDIDIEKGGEARVYHSGEEIMGTWSFEDGDIPVIRVRDSSGSDIPFLPGKIWFQIAEPSEEVIWAMNDKQL